MEVHSLSGNPSMPDTSTSCGTSLIIRLCDNDSLAWNQLVELYGPLVFHWCTVSRIQSCDAADIMQEVFASAVKSIHRFDTRPGHSVRGWLWTITQNKMRDHWRKRNKQQNAVGGTDAHWQMTQVPQTDDPPTGNLETSRLLHRALDQIKGDFAQHTWDAFWQSAIEGRDTNSIAQELHLSPNSVRQAKSRVLRRLREQIGDVK